MKVREHLPSPAQWAKVWWHSLWRSLRFSEDHRMCSLYMRGHSFKVFCNCGYGNGGRTFDGEMEHWARVNQAPWARTR